MKHKFLSKAAMALLLCTSVSSVSAADLYLSSSGADSNDGLSPAAPVKTLSMAFTKALSNDVIHVMDMIEIKNEPTKSGARTEIDITGLSTTMVLVKDGLTYTTWNAANGTVGIVPHARNITIVGSDKATCGFDGGDLSPIIRQDHGTTGTATITYKDLTFKNGKSADNSGGGAVYVRLSNTIATGQAAIFENCEFIANKSKNDKPGGAISVVQQPGIVSLKKCHFSENIASKGAALYLERGTVTIDSCVFENHDLTVASAHLTTTYPAASVGGAIHTNVAAAGQLAFLDVKNTLFKNNKVGANGGAYSSSETNAITTGTTTAKFTNCAFVGNSSGTGIGGAVYLNNIYLGVTQEVTFVNSTFTTNTTGNTAGGAIGVNSYFVNSKFNLINCTVSNNHVSGTTGVAGAGVRFTASSENSVRKILNSIIENNTAVDANSSNEADYADLGIAEKTNVDLTTSPSYVAGTTLIIDKSFVGSCKNANFDTEFPSPANKVNYVFALNGNISNSFEAKLGTFDEEKNYFPLLANSPAIGFGNSTYLTSLTPAVTTDQILRNRPTTGCSAGAYEYATVSAIQRTAINSISIYRNANNQIVVRGSEDFNGATLSLFNLMGQEVASEILRSNTAVIGKLLNSGVYVVVLKMNGKTTSQKVMLN